MLLNCTIKLQQELGIQAPLIPMENPLFSWHANILRINRRKTLILVNDASHYQILLHGLKAHDFKSFHKLIPRAISIMLLSDELNPQLVDAYLNQMPQINYSKTQGASFVARMNKSCDLARRFQELYSQESLVQTALSRDLNKHAFKSNTSAYLAPSQMFYRQLESYFALPLFRCKAVVLHVQLRLEQFQVYRKVVVPLRYTFDQLHLVLQTLFAWRGYHHHDFTLYEQQEAVLNLVACEEAFSYDSEVPMILEDDIPLSHYLPKHKHLLYCYDFDTQWEHEITVEDFLFDYPQNYPLCLDGQGEPPPEDVGGESGYLMYLAIKHDPTHHHYEAMKRWAGKQWDAKFDLNAVNETLQKISNTPLV